MTCPRAGSSQRSTPAGNGQAQSKRAQHHRAGLRKEPKRWTHNSVFAKCEIFKLFTGGGIAQLVER